MYNLSPTAWMAQAAGWSKCHGPGTIVAVIMVKGRVCSGLYLGGQAGLGIAAR